MARDHQNSSILVVDDPGLVQSKDCSVCVEHLEQEGHARSEFNERRADLLMALIIRLMMNASRFLIGDLR